MTNPTLKILIPVFLSIAMSGSMMAQTLPESATGADSPASAAVKSIPSKVKQLPPPPAGTEVSQGERLTLDGKGFTLVAPTGWIVQKNLPRSSLFIQARVIGAEYPRNIAVARFSGSVLINESTANDFAERLVKLYPATSTTIENYTLRNHQSIQMTDGREGILFYTDFTGSGRKMMQAHILVSSETHHYLVTYTDVAEHFENPVDNSPFLAEAWAAMISIQLDSPNPVPAGGMDTAFLTVIGLMVAVVVVTGVRKKMAGRRYKKYAEQAVSEGGDLTTRPSTSAGSIDSSMYAPTVTTNKIVEIDDEYGGAEAASMDDGISSGIGGRILKFRKKAEEFVDDQNDGSSDLEFTDDAMKKQKFKRGA